MQKTLWTSDFLSRILEIFYSSISKNYVWRILRFSKKTFVQTNIDENIGTLKELFDLQFIMLANENFDLHFKIHMEIIQKSFFYLALISFDPIFQQFFENWFYYFLSIVCTGNQLCSRKLIWSSRKQSFYDCCTNCFSD